MMAPSCGWGPNRTEENYSDNNSPRIFVSEFRMLRQFRARSPNCPDPKTWKMNHDNDCFELGVLFSLGRNWLTTVINFQYCWDRTLAIRNIIIGTKSVRSRFIRISDKKHTFHLTHILENLFFWVLGLGFGSKYFRNRRDVSFSSNTSLICKVWLTHCVGMFVKGSLTTIASRRRSNRWAECHPLVQLHLQRGVPVVILLQHRAVLGEVLYDGGVARSQAHVLRLLTFEPSSPS